MTNRERYITKRNQYDLMLTIAENISGIGTFCPIKAISGKKRLCITKLDDNLRLVRDCEPCVQKWLNEESEE